MSNLTKIEELAEKAVFQEFGDGEGRTLWAAYEVARGKIFTELLPYIRATEPFLTDHDEPHIRNVLDNAFSLLGRAGCSLKPTDKALTPAELYLLVLSILFHDVGNVFARAGHKFRIKEAYTFAKGSDHSLSQEKRLLSQIVESHGGTTPKGSSDTIGVLETNAIFKAKPIDLRRVAAILRFADELAEGPQRTSLFMQNHLKIPASSQVHHEYASATTIHIDRKQGRIAIVYDIETCPEHWGGSPDPKRLRRLLEYAYTRLIKLDLERKYNKHYCVLLRGFNQTEATFHFHYKGDDLKIELPKIVLDDLILPDGIDSIATLSKYRDHEVSTLIDRLNSAIKDKSAGH